MLLAVIQGRQTLAPYVVNDLDEEMVLTVSDNYTRNFKEGLGDFFCPTAKRITYNQAIHSVRVR